MSAGKYPTNFRLTTAARKALKSVADKSGRSQTQVIEDLLLEVRKYPPHVEAAIARAARATGMSHEELISACVSEAIAEVERKFTR